MKYTKGKTAKNGKTGIICVTILFLFILSGEGSDEPKVTNGDSAEFQITTDPYYQIFPAIFKNVVVWMDNRSCHCTDFRNDDLDHRNGIWDIYGYNLTRKEEFQIAPHISDQEFPEIYGNIVV